MSLRGAKRLRGIAEANSEQDSSLCSEQAPQSPFSPPLEKGDIGGFEIATLPEFILSMPKGSLAMTKKGIFGQTD